MATSGAMSTDNQYIKYTISITQNSQNVTSNTSNVTVSVRFYRTNTGYTTYGRGTVYCKINGTTYSASVTTSHKITNSGIVLFTKTLNISHNSDGTKTLTCSAWIDHSRVESSEQSYSQTLTTIPRKSTLSVGNGTLGTAQTLTVTRQSTSFTHTITATCSGSSTTVCSKSTSTSISFTPPISWASKNTTGTSVSVTYKIETFNGSTSVGSTSYTKTCSIPSSVVPTVSFSVSDSTGYLSTYGGYVQGQSKFQISISASGIRGSTIKSYSTSANGSKYTASSFTTEVIRNSGTSTITATVTDSRGRTASASKSVTVLAYSTPKITSMTVIRCSSNGTANSSGAYLGITFSSSVTSLSSKNTATYTVQYKKTSESSYTSATLTNYANNYSVTNGSYVFAADTTSSYDVIFKVTDNFTSSSKTAEGGTTSKTFSFLQNGTGIAFGKVAENEGFEVEWPSTFNGATSFGAPVYNQYGERIDNEFVKSSLTTSLLDYAENLSHNGFFCVTLGGSSYTANDLPTTPGYWEYGSAIIFRREASSIYVVLVDCLGQIATNGINNSNAWNGWRTHVNSNGGVMTGTLTNKATNNYLGQFRFNAHWMGIYSDTTYATRYGWIGYNSSFTAMCLVNETGNLEFNIRDSTYRIIFVADATDGSQASLRATPTGTIYLGNASYKWKAVYASSGSIVTSDRKQKKDFAEFDEKYENLFFDLKPTLYRFIDNNSNRIHSGFIAQDVEESLEENGLTALDFAAFCKDKAIVVEKDENGEDVEINKLDEDGNQVYDYSLRYEEFIALNTHMLQKAYAKIDEQQKQIDSLQAQIDELKLLIASK